MVQQGLAYAQCGGATPLETDLGTIQVYAARGGARSADFTMCQTSAFLIARRMIYWKNNPGDCGSTSQAIGASGLQIGVGVGSKLVGLGAVAIGVPVIGTAFALVAGLAGAITAHHTQAVAQEQSTLCAVAGAYNDFAAKLEAALSNGQVSAADASALLDNLAGQLSGALSSIKKECNSACGFLIALRALQLFNEEVVFPRIAASFTALVGSAANSTATAVGNAINGGVPGAIPFTGVGTTSGGVGLLAVLGGALYLGVHAL